MAGEKGSRYITVQSLRCSAVSILLENKSGNLLKNNCTSSQLFVREWYPFSICIAAI